MPRRAHLPIHPRPVPSVLRVTGALLATLLGTILALGQPGAAFAQGRPPAAAAATEATGPQFSKPFAKNLTKANELLQKDAYDELLALLDKTDGMANKTPGDQFFIDYFRAQGLAKQNRLAEALPYYEKVIASDQVPPERLANEIALVARIAGGIEPRDWAKAASYGSRYLEVAGNDRDMLELVTIAHYQAGQPDRCDQALKYGEQAFAAASQSGEKPAEGVLQILQRCAESKGDAAGNVRYATELVRNYPKQDYWGTAVTMLLRGAEKSDAQTLEVLRLVLALDLMGTAGGYLQLAQLARDAGLPGEAEAAISKGLKSGVFTNAADKTRGNELLADATAAAALDRKELPSLEAEARAAKTGDADVLLGEAFLSYGQADKAIEAVKRGLGKGVKNTDEANLLLGKAYVRANQGAEAGAAFAKVAGGQYGQLASLWAILATTGVPTE